MANYLPVLLVSVTTNAIPDDSSLTTLPRGQVDYLSHHWREEDVWLSWRNMTRQKNEIANGMRLENASWRTWWKQRNNLKTVTPEKLNWLKDSDVTWLYGPLHTAVEWSPPPKPPSPPIIVGKDNSAHDRLNLSTAKKPILKHRSISEFLTGDLSSPLFSPTESDNDDTSSTQDNKHLPNNTGNRPTLLHTKSDSHITRWGPNRAFRKESPPRVIASEPVNPALSHHTTPSNSNSNLASSYSNSASGSTCSVVTAANLATRDYSPSGVLGATAKRKHISFNTFVERYIAIEKPSPNWRADEKDFDGDDDGYDEDKEDQYESWNGHRPSSHPDSDSDDGEDDDVLEMRTPSTLKSQLRSKSKASSSSSSSVSPGTDYRRRPPLRRTLSTEREHVTIAPIAPTILKTTGMGGVAWGENFGDDDYSDDAEGRWYPRERERVDSSEGTPVELVYLPPLGSNYHMQIDEEEPPEMGSMSPIPFDTETEGAPGHYGSLPLDGLLIGDVSELAISPPSPPPQPRVGDAYEYFGGPDLGEDSTRIRRRSDVVGFDDRDDRGGREMLRFAQGGAASVTVGRNSGTGGTGTPEVVVNGVAEGEDVVSRSRSRSRSKSGSRTPSPVEFTLSTVLSMPPALLLPPPPPLPTSSSALPVPRGRGRSLSYSPPALLSPPTRGRPGIPKSSSSASLGEHSHSHTQARGRSSTRSSPSFSDRDGLGSPLGSNSPDGSALALGLGSIGPGGIASARGIYSGRGERERERNGGERGRERTTRRVGGSLSFDDALAVGGGGGGARMGINSMAMEGNRSNSFSSGSSSLATVVPMESDKTKYNPADVVVTKSESVPVVAAAVTAAVTTATLPLLLSEEEEQRSRHPTPVNSPVLELSKPALPIVSPPVSPTTATFPHSPAASSPLSAGRGYSSPTVTLRTVKNRGIYSSTATATVAGAGHQQHLENGSLVGRAVGIVSSAGSYLGLWHNGIS